MFKSNKIEKMLLDCPFSNIICEVEDYILGFNNNAMLVKRKNPILKMNLSSKMILFYNTRVTNKVKNRNNPDYSILKKVLVKW